MNAQMVFQEIGIQNQTISSSKSASLSNASKKEGNSFQDLLNSVSNEKASAADSNEKTTYAQVANSSKAAAIKYKRSVNETEATTATEENVTEENADELQMAASNSVLNGIAALLGIDSSSLKQVMANLDIKPEDLLDSSKLNEIVQQLSLKLGLTTGQELVLTAAIKQFSKLAQEAVSDNKTSQTSNDMVIVEGVKIEVVNKETAEPGKTITHLDEDIRQLADSIKRENASLFSDVPEKFASILEEFGGVKTDANVNVSKQDSDSVANTKEGKKAEDTEISEAVTSPKGVTEDSSKNTGSSLLNADNTKGDGIPLTQTQDNLNQIQKEDFAAKLNNVTTEHRVVKNEIMQQVVEQAKVIVDEGRSEMVMQMKPESLGKLTLKIVTENGIVAAKFVAENQQVKQVLETNMQILKDSLEKQGMSVQNVSVSVGQNGSQNFSQREAFERRGRKNSKLNLDSGYIAGADTETIEKTNPYEVSENSIDVIA